MTQIVHVEKYSSEYCKKLANLTHQQMLSVWGDTETSIKGEITDIKIQTNTIRKLCKNAIKNGFKRNVSYKYSKKNPTSGRLYADGTSLQNIKRQFRGLLSAVSAIDFDVVNCHPCLLLHLCKRHNGIVTSS